MIEERIKNINYLTSANENHYLDRKSARKRPNDLLKYIVGFANAAGGYLVIGIDGFIDSYLRSMIKADE